MKQKDKYTLRELFDNLPIPLTELSKLSGKSHGTLTRIRDGEPARRSTINKLLIILSEVYRLDLSLDNVTGIVLEERQEKATEKSEKPPVPTPVKTARAVPEKATKRTYKAKDTALPDGAILAKHFAENHNVRWGTFYDHLTKGLGQGLIDMSTDTIPERDRVAHESPVNPTRKGETIRYLTSDQQHGALEFWLRHNVGFTQCENTACWCHTFLEESE